MRDWSGDATKIFKGKVVSHIRYTDVDESAELGWSRTPIIIFTDGTFILASRDDEGNDGGAFFTSEPEMEVIPQGGR